MRKRMSCFSTRDMHVVNSVKNIFKKKETVPNVCCDNLFFFWKSTCDKSFCNVFLVN